MFDLKDTCALVTGASGGIGSAIAKALHAAGATVCVSGTRLSALEEVAAEMGPRTHILACDLSKPDEVEALVGRAEAAMGKLDILVNNAGLTRDQLSMRMKDEDWQAVLDVNLTAPFRLSRAAMRGMMKRRHGRIINITSVVGATGNPGQANYVSAKAGLAGLSKSLAQEVASRGITVNCVAPGMVDGPRFRDKVCANMADKLGISLEEAMTRHAADYAMKRVSTDEDIAHACLFLASDLARQITGVDLPVDGGWAML